MTTIAIARFSRYISLYVAPNGLECVWHVKALHYAAIYEQIFELQQPKQLMEKAREDTDSKCCMTTAHSYIYILIGKDQKGLMKLVIFFWECTI